MQVKELKDHASRKNKGTVEQAENVAQEKKTKVSAKQISEQIQSIKNATETIKVAVEQNA